jgi:hypothetical protein
VLTLRDLARQVPAEWQEGVKHGRRLSFPEYLECVLGGHGRPSLRQRFWRAQDVVGVCDRWAADLPPERVHLVTCPPSGARPDLLWARFAEVLDISPDGVQLPGGDINASLGAVQVELLRRLNEHFPRTGQEIDYRAVVKDYYARDVLGAFPSEKTVLPASWSSTVEKIGSGWVEKLGRRGYRVVGDLRGGTTTARRRTNARHVGAQHRRPAARDPAAAAAEGRRTPSGGRAGQGPAPSPAAPHPSRRRTSPTPYQSR